MSVVISFSSGIEWFKANWVFRQLVEEVTGRYPDADLVSALEKAQAFNHLDFRVMENGLAIKLMSAIRAVAYDTVQGLIAGRRPEDDARHTMYREAMSELLAMIDRDVQGTPS